MITWGKSGLFSDFQYHFRSSQSIAVVSELLGFLTGLGLLSLMLISDILEIMDSLQTDVFFITIVMEKAFDSVNHSS